MQNSIFGSQNPFGSIFAYRFTLRQRKSEKLTSKPARTPQVSKFFFVFDLASFIKLSIKAVDCKLETIIRTEDNVKLSMINILEIVTIFEETKYSTQT